MERAGPVTERRICPPPVDWRRLPPTGRLRRLCLPGPVGPLWLELRDDCVLRLGFACGQAAPQADAEGWCARLFGGLAPVPVYLRGTPFQEAVWRALLEIPCGQTRSYGELAAALRRPGGARAVGQAVGANPLAWLVPCHRVLAAHGPGGYHWGLAVKRRLLALEGVELP